MQDRPRMRIGKRRRELDGDAKCFVERQRATLVAGGERFAFDVLHCEKITSVNAAELVERADIRMIERRNGARFTQKPRLDLRRVMARLDEFDRGLPLQ